MHITTDTIIRTIVLIIALVNQTLTSLGKNPLPFADDIIYEMVSLLVTIVAAAIAWWKNNSFTKEAIQADEYMKELKQSSKEVTEEEVE